MSVKVSRESGFNKTDLGILAGVAVLLGVEAWTLVNKTPNDTISERVWRVSTKRPLVPFVLGFLMGHFVWQAAPEEPDINVEHADKVEVNP